MGLILKCSVMREKIKHYDIATCISNIVSYTSSATTHLQILHQIVEHS